MKEPFGMPHGSIRGILAIMAFFTACILAIQSKIDAKDFLTLVTMIGVFYFTMRAQQPPANGGS